ncbi:MAG: methyltransferase domain-containing protein [Chloroflexota bacterium]|nr:methyltransferase domain-containing protein [Chloroflexota bacterium]
MSDFPTAYFDKQDPSDDSLFYTSPRKVVHIDDGAIRALSEQFAVLLPTGGIYLDLMSSWRSHLPPSLKPARVIGLGMNADEMRDNPALGKFVVHNLNRNPILPFDAAAFDAAFCTVSVQYLQHPIDVFRDVGRVCKSGAPFVVSFSNRCFPTKAVAIWGSTSDNQHLALVARYFEDAGNWIDVQTWSKPRGGRGGDPLFIVSGKRKA